MSKQLEFYFDFGSPTAYLAYCRLGQLAQQYELDIHYKPMLLGGVFKAAANSSPITVPAKGKYMLEQDLPRFAARYNVPLNFNPFFPINTLGLMRAAIAAEQMACLDTYLVTVFKAVWVDSQNMGDPEVVAQVLASAGLDAEALITRSQSAEVKAELISNTEAAVARGVFGAPTLFMDDAMYFGQDRLDFIEEALRS